MIPFNISKTYIKKGVLGNSNCILNDFYNN